MFFSETGKILVTPALVLLASDDLQIHSKAFYSWKLYIMKSIVIQGFNEDEIPKPFPWGKPQ